MGGTMSVNGTPDANIELTIAITDGSGTAFSDDSIPGVFHFSFPGPPHTFSLGDREGTLLKQFVDVTSPVRSVTWGHFKRVY